MVIGAEQHKAETLARQTIERLKADNRSPSPNNYALFYHYYSGLHPNLNMAIDMLLSQSGVITQQQCDDLFRTHLGLGEEHKILKQANDAIEAEVQRVLGMIDASTTNTNKYSKTLDSFSGKLEGSTSLDQIREAVTKVVGETRVMAQQNERLQQQLAQTTEQLTEMRYSLDAVHKESQIDPLTEVGNRKFLDREMARVIKESIEADTPLTLLMIDIDHFKKFNDTFGHQVGDQVLRLVAKTLVENLKGQDIIARYGGEEFSILLPQTTVHDAEKLANGLRARLSTKQLKRRSTNETLGNINVSIGAAQLIPGEDTDDFISRADVALYKAKQAGRNRVMLSIPTPAELEAIKASIENSKKSA